MTEELASHPVALLPQSEFALSEEALISIRSTVKSLPPDRKQSIEMAFFSGMTHAEIAGALNEPLGHRQGAHSPWDVEIARKFAGLHMISEQQQEQASLYALGALGEAESRA